MKMNKIILGLAVALSTSLTYGQIDRSIVPTPKAAPEISIADPVVFDLDNGMKVILSTNTKIPKVSFNLVMGSDPALEGNKAGLSDIMGSLLLSGTSNRTKDEIDNEKDFIGAGLYASSSSLYLSVMTKHMNKGLDLLTDVMQNANFPESEFERIKKQSESGLYSAKSDAGTMMNNAMSKAIFTDNHPYGEVMTEESLNNIKLKDVVELYKQRFTPAGSYLVIVGDIDEATARKVAKERFSNWEGGNPYKKEYHHGISPKGNRVIFIEKPGAVQSVIGISFPVDMIPGDDDQIKLELLNRLFGGGGFGTRLMQNLREDKAYTYGAYSSLDVNREGSYLYATGNFRNDVTDSAIVEFLYEVNNLIKDKPSLDEINLSKATMAGGFARSLESPRTIANFALNINRNDLPADYYQTYLKKLSDVTPDDLLEMANKYVKPNNLNIIVVGNKDVLPSLVQFDADGEIELFDAFGNATSEKEYLPSPLTKEQILEKYILSVTGAKNLAKAKKTIAKVKTLKKDITITIAGAPMEMQMTEYYKTPNMERKEMTFSGMPIQQETFNGTSGASKTMNQMGGFDVKELTAEEVEEKKKTAGLFPELTLLTEYPDAYELLGMEVRKNNEHVYVIQYKIGTATTTNYYSAATLLKVESNHLDVTEEGPQSATSMYRDYTKFGKILFPKEVTQLIESVSMTAKLMNVEINKGIDDKKFTLK